MKIALIFFLLLLTSFAFAQSNLEIIKIGHPTLRAQAVDVNFADIQTSEFQKLVDDMSYTRKKHFGVGLAAPQVNVSIRLFVMGGFTVPLKIIINPKLEYLEEFGQQDSTEGCLSIPGKSLTVKRYKKVRLSYFNRKGEYLIEELSKLPAIVAQHEYDHLNGVMIVDLVDQMFSQINYSGYVNAPLM